MTLEKHITDTVKEWEVKIGTDDAGIKLYYPKNALCGYLSIDKETDNEEVKKLIGKRLEEKADYLSDSVISYGKERFCIAVSGKACRYIESNVETPAFLNDFLAAVKTGKMDEVRRVFSQYASEYGDVVIEEEEENGMGHRFSYEKGDKDPYVYCVEDDGFRITYHRFEKGDYEHLGE